MMWISTNSSWLSGFLRISLVVSAFSGALTDRLERSSGWFWPASDGSTPPKQSQPEEEQNYDIPQAKAEEFEILEPKHFFTFLYPPTTTTTAAPTTAATRNCTCVAYYFCDESQVVDTTGSGWQCKKNLQVCCRRPTFGTTTQKMTWTTSPTATSTGTAVPGYTPRCGTLNPNGINARILGFKDSETQFGEYPWMGALLQWKFVKGRKAFQFVCGASLIWPSVVITAAHCVNGKRPDHLVARLGEWDTQSTSEFYPHQDIQAQEIVLHPQYYGGGLFYDVALVFLTAPVVLAPHIDTICLPKIKPANYDNSSCWATGWGKDQFGANGSYQAILKEVELPITPRNACQTALRKTDLGLGFNLDESFLCAGGLRGLDTCVGDGGGPLVCPSRADPSRYVLAGVVSWGIRCGNYGVPGVYVDVRKVRSWIDQTILARISRYDTSRVTIGVGAKPSG